MTTQYPTAEELKGALATLEAQFGRFDRKPFQQMLAELMGCKPTFEALQAFANKNPDRWAQAVQMMANLSGFEKGNVTLNIFNVEQMSDAMLLAEHAKAAQANARHGLRPPRTIEAAPEEVRHEPE